MTAKLSICPKNQILLFFQTFWAGLDKIRLSPITHGFDLNHSVVKFILFYEHVRQLPGSSDIALYVFPGFIEVLFRYRVFVRTNALLLVFLVSFHSNGNYFLVLMHAVE